MAITNAEMCQARQRAKTLERRSPKARGARIDASSKTLVVDFENGVVLSVPVASLQGLAGMRVADIAQVQVSPSGMGLHFPKVDADVYLPALLAGVLGSQVWMRQATK